ncbi:MAG TPA: cation diffusion facilitator family transporter [Ktedonobacterales bacterium]|nr:cation diffusion facilitator family transporter [Ktedonobacterales bacterium]
MAEVRAHQHSHAHQMAGATLRTAFFLTAVILLVEVVGGVFSHSLALLSDAGHVFTDIIALGLAWFAHAQAERPADARRTYGYHRIGILAALANALTLILIVAAIAYEAVQRLQHPAAVTPWVMFGAAAVGIAVNVYIGLGLRAAGSDNLNVRAALLHVVGDVGASAAVIVGGVIILLTGWYPADPLISLAIALLIAWSAWRVLRETLGILMESVPRDVNIAQLVRDMVQVPGVKDVHDLHVWSIAGGMHALSAHVQVADRPLSACDTVIERLNCLLRDRYRIAHTTIQLECAGCVPNDLYCALSPDAGDAHSHGDAPAARRESRVRDHGVNSPT